MAGIEQDFSKAVARFRAGDLKSSEKILLNINKRQAGIPDVLHLLAYVALETGRPGRAVTYLSQAIKRVPDNAGLLQLLGCAHHKDGDVDRAIEVLTRAVALDPGMADARYNLANALQEAGRLGEAAAEYRRLIAMTPGDESAHAALGQTLLSLGDPGAALDAFMTALKIDPKDAENHCNVGVALSECGRLEEAEAHLERAVALRPEMRKALYYLADVKHAMNKPEDAISVISKALQHYPDDDNLHRLLGIINLEAGEFEKALSSARSARKLNPGNADNLYALALILEKSNVLDEARETVAEGLALDAENAGLNIVSARLAFRAGEHAKALGILTSRTMEGELSPDLKMARYFELGRVHDRLGDADEAFRNFAKGNETAARIRLARHDEKHVMVDYVQRHADVATPQWISSWTPMPDGAWSDPSPVFMVGFPRSGTTLIDQILDGHPGIQVLEEEPMMRNVRAHLMREGSSYPQDIAGMSADQIAEARALYFQTADKFLDRKADALLVDKMPLNLVEAALIHRLFPDARFILCLRHPCDACLSCFMQLFELNAGMSNFLTLEDTTSLYESVMSLWQRYVSLLPLEVFSIRYEDLLEDPEARAKDLIGFLDLSWDDQVLAFDSHARTRSIKTPSYAQVSSGLYMDARFRWLRYEKYLRPYVGRLQPFIEAFGYSRTPDAASQGG